MTPWPAIPYPDWADTHALLHLAAQVVGKYRLAHTPWEPHSWHATLYVVPRGLTTGPVPDATELTGGSVLLDIDLHALPEAAHIVARNARGVEARFPLESMSVAEVLGATRDIVEDVGGRFQIHGHPNEVPDPVPFARDTVVRPWDADAVRRFHGALVRVDSVFRCFRTGFLGRVSPSHLFWGGLDLAVTRFSGRQAPLHPGGVPHLPDSVTREAYSHEVASSGFWAGGAGVDEPMFYSYSYPAPDGYRDATVEPDAARWHTDLGEWVLPYQAVRESADPGAMLLAFLQSTYNAAADLGGWDRAALDAPLGEPGVVRPLGERP